MVQVPLVSDDAVPPAAMVQSVGVVEAKLTPRPEEAVAVKTTPVSATSGEGMAGKVMACGAAWLIKKATVDG